MAMFDQIKRLFQRPKVDEPAVPSETTQELFQNAKAQLPPEVFEKLTSVTPGYISTLKLFDPRLAGLYRVDVPVKEAEDVWKSLYLQRAEIGYFPIISTDDLRYDQLAETKDSTEGVSQAALDGDAEAYFTEKMPEVFDGSMDDIPDFYTVPSPGSMPETKSFYVVTKAKKTVPILLFAGKHGYEILSLLPFGGWNACPFDQEHLVVLKYWNEKYGAELAAMDSDILELYLDKPVTDEDRALLVAKQQFIYCDDIVSQGTDTIGNLARTLMDSHIWFFWWD